MRQTMITHVSSIRTRWLGFSASTYKVQMDIEETRKTELMRQEKLFVQGGKAIRLTIQFIAALDTSEAKD